MKQSFILFFLLLTTLPSFGSRELVATCLIREAGARGECMASVMHVISNRARGEKTIESFTRVITRPWQFESIHNQNHAAIIQRAKAHPRWPEAMQLVDQATLGTLPPTPAMRATHFFNPRLVQPRWASSMQFVARIGNHDFYYGR